MSDTPDHPDASTAAPAPPAETNPRWFSAVALCLSAVAVGYAIHIRDGEYIPVALKWITIGLALCAAGVALPRVADSKGWGARSVLPVLTAALAIQFYQLFLSPAGGRNWWSNDVRDLSWDNVRPYYVGVALAASVCAGLLARGAAVRNACLAVVLLVHFLLGLWMIRASPQPHIDVFVFQQGAPQALRDGVNPYAVEFPDIYHGTGQEKDRSVYGKGLSEDGKLKFGFPYPPLSLYLSSAGYFVAGDHRYAQLAAMTLAGLLIAFCRPGRVAALAAALLLFTPRGFFVLGRAWTEPFVVLTVAATVFCACRAARAMPAALGLLLAVKQYMVFAGPLALLLTPRPWTVRRVMRVLVPAGIVAAVVSAPLVLWDVGAFYHSAATVQKEAPFRDDALSYLVWLRHRHGVEPGMAIPMLAMLAGMALALWRCPRDPSGFAAAVAMTYLPFIAFNKQAFANYYYFVIGSLCCAVAAAPAPLRPRGVAGADNEPNIPQPSD